MRNTETLWIVAASYAAIGFFLVTIGPLGQDLRARVREMRRRRELAAQWHLDDPGPPPSGWKLLLFYVMAGLGGMVAWPIFVPGIIATKREKVPAGDAAKQRSFRQMGGAGDIVCRACGHEERIVSLLHGSEESGCGWSVVGYQCQRCWGFVKVQGGANEGPLRCQCGGELSRDETVRCSACGSGDASYHLRMIT